MDEFPNPMSFDLNLEPPVNPSPWHGMSLDEYLNMPFRRFREAFRNAGAIRDVVLGLETGDGSDNKLFKDEELGKKGSDSEDMSFFDCNICMELAKEPVVTCCGHLFCWVCVYRWLNIHSKNNECPICKGEVTTKSVTPIYGRVNDKDKRLNEDPNLKIPPRPQAKRVESWRQTIERNAYSVPMQEMFRRLGRQFDDGDTSEIPERRNSLLNRILTTRARREYNRSLEPENDDVDVEVNLDQSPTLSPLLDRGDVFSSIALSELDEMMFESLVESHRVERNEDQIRPVDDRDSLSSIAAVIQSESQEMDSTVSRSTSSSRRRNAASRVSGIDSGDSRPLTRRRFHPN